MKPGFSEFSFGYAWTEAMVRDRGLPITAAPIFPSLLEEGRQGGGYDLKLLRRPGIPLLVQFKLTDYIQRTAQTQERRRGMLSGAFYRFHLRTQGTPNQHALLLQHDLSLAPVNDVFYVVPCFHRSADFERHYDAKRVPQWSAYCAPSAIGAFADNRPHHVSFNAGGWCRCSTPQPMKSALGFPAFTAHLLAKLQTRDVTVEQSMGQLLEGMIGLLTDGHLLREYEIQALRAELDTRPSLLDRIAYLARRYYDATLFVVMERGATA